MAEDKFAPSRATTTFQMRWLEMTHISASSDRLPHQQRVVVPVSDVVVCASWYERLLDRPPEPTTSESSVTWTMPGGDELTIERDSGHAGGGLVGFAVDNLEATKSSLNDRRIALTPDLSGRAFAKDPSGNEVVFREA